MYDLLYERQARQESPLEIAKANSGQPVSLLSISSKISKLDHEMLALQSIKQDSDEG